MHKLLFIITLMIGGALLCTESLSGQQAQEPDGSLLPDIDPQDIEIRSQYRARFPGLQRQPILGFRPGSRVYQIDPDRSPFLEELEDIAAQLPIDELSRPEEPEYRFFPYASPRTGYAQVGFANHLSPEARFHVNQEVGENQWLSGSVSHTSSDGHLDQNSSFRYFGLESNFRGKIGDRTVVGANFGLNSDFNYLPQLESDNMEITGNPGRKNYSDLHAGTRVKWYKNSIEHLDIGLNAWFNSIVLDEEEMGFSSDLNDWGVTADGGYTWAGERINETYAVNFDLQAGSSEQVEGENENWSIMGASGTYSRFFNHRTKLNATLGFYHVTDAADNSTFYVAPNIRADHYASDRITISASISGQPKHASHFDLHQENRFLLPDNQLQHSYNLITAAEITVEPITNNKIRAGVSYLSGKNYPIFQRSDFDVGFPVIETIPGHYQVDYQNITIQKAYAGIDVDLIKERLWFDVEGYMQNPSLSADQKIPFTESYGLKGAVSIRPVDRLLVEGWGNFVGSRNTLNNTVLDPYLHLGTKVELRLTDRIGVYGKMLNLLNQDYEIWEGFKERPFQVYGGITMMF